MVPGNGPLPASNPTTFSTPFPTCLVQMSKIESLPKAKESRKLLSVHGLWPQLAHSGSSMEIRFCSSVCCETKVSLFFFFLSKPTQQLCPDMLSPRAEKAAKNVNRACENMVMVCVVSCFQVFLLCLLHGGSPPSVSLSPSPTLAPPPAPSPVAPTGRFPPLTSRRHSRHCRPHTESSLPHGCPHTAGPWSH